MLVHGIKALTLANSAKQNRESTLRCQQKGASSPLSLPPMLDALKAPLPSSQQWLGKCRFETPEHQTSVKAQWEPFSFL